ncbi:VWA domain-containing protein [Treponema putidum]|uniref:VWA domain-containing protein n=1 Tax=Treponema putidum TaxID=221027 RepID=UPI0011998371|nr:VWA domain-containing protein [Treponema putidum]TWI79705.1 Ca-activated chloride channel family protein [Treponema putidum]
MISFNHPIVFLLLLLFPFFFILKKNGLMQSPELNLNLVNWKGLFPKKNKLMEFGNFLSYFLWYCGIIFLIITLSEPVIFKNKQMYTDAGSSIMFLLDISPSMAAKDMNGETRIESAKKIIRKFVAKYPGDSFGLAALSSSAALIVPPTIDHKVFLSRLNSLSIGELGDGTAIGMGLAVSSAYMTRSKFNSSYIILLTDGENNTGEINPKTAATSLVNKNIGFYVIGIGSAGYTTLEYTDRKTGKTYSGSIFSKFDELELKKTAQYGNGKYASASSPEMLENIFNTMSKQIPSAQSNFTQIIEENLYVYFLSASIFSFAFAWLLRRIFMRVYL